MDATRELQREEYPIGLGEIPEPPEQLWIRGSLPPAGTKILTVVGSRALSAYGREACKKLIEGLAGYSVCIVSGLALGADVAAHRAALAAGLHTIAMPGSGISDETISPRTNIALAREVLASGGALLSEYDSETIGAPWTFPQRNRLMVGIADAVLMIEAGPKSGTLITARLSSEYNRELLCIPHRIGDPNGFESHLFLRLGATLVTEPLHILEALKIPPRIEERQQHARVHMDDAEREIYDLLDTPLPRDEVIRQSKLPAHQALTLLAMLELKGHLKEEFGAWRKA